MTFRMSLSEIASATQGEQYGPDVEISGVSIDTRTLKTGDLYIAIKGERFDGHDFIDNAFEQGAAAVVVSVPISNADASFVQVADTTKALGAIANAWRRRFSLKSVAVTGSCGKTTVKEMTASILAQCGRVLSTEGNKNNEIGVPLTLLRLDDTYDYAVFELGANHIGEIAYTVSLAEPDAALITYVGHAHTEGFGGIEGVLKAKTEIYQGLAGEATAVINDDLPHAGFWREVTASHPQLLFSTDLSSPAQDERTSGNAHTVQLLSASPSKIGWRMKVLLRSDYTDASEVLELELPLMGRHNVTNAVAAIALAVSLGAQGDAVVTGLQQISPIPGRLFPVELGDQYLVIDDSYNANPSSVQAAIDVLAERPSDMRILVLGDMAELDDVIEWHRKIGEYARQKGIEYVMALGEYAVTVCEGYDEAGTTDSDEQRSSLVVENHEAAAEHVQALFAGHGSGTALVKGSRSSAMEKVVDALREAVAA